MNTKISLKTKRYVSSTMRVMTLIAMVVNAVAFPMSVAQAQSGDDGLISYWNFDEDSGSTADDTSPAGYGNTGTLVNSPQWIASPFGSALGFDANSDQYVSTLNNSDSLSIPSGGLAITAWINAYDVSGVRNVLAKDKQGTTSRGNYSLAVVDGILRFGFSQASDYGDNWIDTQTSISPNRWYSVAVTHTYGNSSETAIYINGVSQPLSEWQCDWGCDPNSAPAIFANDPLYIGKSICNGENFDGLIDEVKIYDRVLGPEEIEYQPSLAVGLVTDVGGLDDPYEWNSLVNQGLMQAENDFDVIGTRYESTIEDDYELLLQQCVDDGNELCIASSFMLYDAIVNVATTNPTTGFVLIDYPIAPEELPNLRVIPFSHDQLGYLAGALAGKMTATNKVGDVAGMNIPPVSAFVDGFTNGAQCANPDVEVITNYTGTFVDPDLGATTAQAMMGQGADVIFGVGGMTGNGAILYSAQNGVWSIGVDVDLYPTLFENGAVVGADKLLTSAMKHLDLAVYQSVNDFVNGDFTSGVVEYDLAVGGVGLAPFHDADSSIPQAVKDYLISVEQGIINGSIDINEPCRGEPYNPSFSVRLTENQVHGYGWLIDSDVDLLINGEYIDTQTVTQADWDPNQTFVWFDLGESLTLQAGQFIEMTDGTITKSHTVTSLMVDGVDADADTVFGTADPDSQVDIGHIYCDENGCFGFRREVADSNGDWLADFSEVGEDDDEQDIVHITPGMGNEARQCDEDGDCTQYGWYARNPVIWAHPNDSPENWIDVRDWAFGETVYLTIDNDTDPSNGVLYSDTGVVAPADWNPSVGVKVFHLGTFDLQPGHIVTLTGATTTKVLVISDLNVTDINPDLDTISGTAAAGSAVQAWFHEEHNCNFEVYAAENGSWTVNFRLCDVRPAIGGGIGQVDDEDDSTVYFWRVLPILNPRIIVSLHRNAVIDRGWPENATLTLSIDDPTTGPGEDFTAQIIAGQGETFPHAYLGFALYDQFQIQPGHIVTVSGGGYSVTHIVKDLRITDVDSDNDIVSGKCTSGSEVRVTVHGLGQRTALVDPAGNWSVNFSEPEEEFTYDITPATEMPFACYDKASISGETESMYPARIVGSVHGDVWVHNWKVGQPIFLEIDDPATQQSPDFSTVSGPMIIGPWFYTGVQFPVSQAIDLQPGFLVTATQGVQVQTHTITGITINEVNTDDDTVSGTANPNAFVLVGVDSGDEGLHLVQADGEGNWTADYKVPGSLPPWQATADILEDTYVSASEFDNDGNHTWVSWHVLPNPTIIVRANEDRIAGQEWPLGATVTVTINDPGTDPNPDITRIANVYDAPWNPGELRFDLDLRDVIDIQPNFEVTASDGTTTKAHTVTSLEFTEIDIDTDTVTGTATANSQVDIWTCDNTNCYNSPSVFADGNGDWVADFTNIYDIVGGTWVDSSQRDDDGDQTMFGQNVPNPHLTVFPEWEAVEVWDWPDGVTVYASVVGKPTCTAQGLSEYPVWDPWTTNLWMNFPENCDVTVGDVVTVTDNETPRTHVVQNITITEANAETETVTGTADPGAVVYVWPHEYGEYQLELTADGGTWLADFAAFGNILQPGTDGGRAEVRDEDGNSTAVDWHIPNPNIQVRANFDAIEGYEWPAGATITIEIDDPNPANPDYPAQEVTVGTAPWDPNQSYFELNLWDVFDIQPGFIVIATDGVTIRQHTVVNLEFTDINIDADIVTGTAAPDGQIDIWACEFNNCFNIDGVPVDEFGDWAADFQGVYNIQPGTWIDSIQRDEQGNGTMFGQTVEGAQIAGTIYALENELVIEAGGVMVEACNTDQSVCRNALTDESGNYAVAYLPKGEFNLKAYPAGNGLPGYSSNPIAITDYDTYTADDIVLPGPPPPPPSGAIEPSHEGGGTIVVYIGDQLTLTTHGDPGGTATFEITVYEDGYIDNGPMAETPSGSGTYIATIPPLASHHGVAEIVYTITYPDKDPEVTSFFIYIDPSGVVVTTSGIPIAGATVTLLRSDNPDGPFEEVHDGSVFMSPSNRTNPDTTDEYGKYGWDVLTGFYIVRAEFPGCYSPDDPSQLFVESEVLTIPPPVFDLILELECPNLPPRNVIISAPADPLPITDFVTVQVDFTDPDEDDDYTVVIDWGDMTTTNTTVTGLSAIAVHQYQSAGVYTIEATVTDSFGKTAVATFQYVVIYDPEGGFVTGGGWIWSPLEAYTPDPSLTGKATFGFVSKYKKGANVPTGNTEFQFKVADLNFKSTSYDWLVIAGSKAQYKGTGTINGAGEYKFMLSAIDGSPDKFRIKIWDAETGVVVYDNMLGSADTDIPSTILGGGSIVIHKPK